MEHLHKMVMEIHPLMDLFIKIGILEIGVKDQPDPLEIRAILRQAPIANHRKEMRQLFRLPDDSLDCPITQIILERPIAEL